MTMEKTNETSIAKVEPMRMVMSPTEMGREVQTLDDLYKRIMTKGTDYDTIPGTPKPTLLKPGAEMLLRAFHLEPVTEIMDKTNMDDADNPFFDFTIKVTLYWIMGDGRKIRIGDGMGSANTRETRYAYRWLFGNDLPLGFDKQNAVKRTVKGYQQYRRNASADEIYTLKNTVMKMAEKRALVDAVLKVTGADRIFTQDVEDMDLPPMEPSASEEKPRQDMEPKKTLDEKILARERNEAVDKAFEVSPYKSEIIQVPTRAVAEMVMVRFLKPVLQFTGIDLKSYGPYNAEDVGNIPKDNAKGLTEAGYVQEIVVEEREKRPFIGGEVGGLGEKSEQEKEASKMWPLKGSDGTVYGKIDYFEDGVSGGYLVQFDNPINMAESGALINGFLVKRLEQLGAAMEKEGKQFSYEVNEVEGAVSEISVSGELDDRRVQELAKSCCWVALRASEKKTS